MDKQRLGRKGFTLVELMIVVVIIGILASVAIPSYMKHIKKTKAQEAVTNLSGIAQYEEAYFAENDQYLSCDPNPSTAPKGGVLQTFDPNAGNWAKLGRVIPNQPVLFQYSVRAGSPTNASGAATALNTSVSSTRPGSSCSSGGPSGNYGDYISTAVNPHWFFASAWGNQDGDSICSFFGIAIDRNNVVKQDELE